MDSVTLLPGSRANWASTRCTSLMTQLAAGECVPASRARIISSRLAKGCRSHGERVAILTDMAIKADDIDEAKAEEARRRAEARLQDKLGADEHATVQAALLHSLTQLNVKRRRRG